jgi:hypothetical protein
MSDHRPFCVSSERTARPVCFDLTVVT